MCEKVKQAVATLITQPHGSKILLKVKSNVDHEPQALCARSKTATTATAVQKDDTDSDTAAIQTCEAAK